MKHPFCSVNPFSLIVIFFLVALLSACTGSVSRLPQGDIVATTLAEQPLAFEANGGQFDPNIAFFARGAGYNMFLRSTEIVLSLSTPRPGTEGQTPEPAVVSIQLVGANQSAKAIGVNPQLAKVNYFTGDDPAKWATAVPTYSRVESQGVYPGIDLVYYGKQHQLEYDFVVFPGADPALIRLGLQGLDGIELNDHGDLLLHTGAGQLTQRAPVIYQEIDGMRQIVAGGFKLLDEFHIGFQIGDYDPRLPLVIDPVLVYSTFLGSPSDDQFWAATFDAAGNAYVTGYSKNINGPLRPYAGGDFDAVVAKFDPNGMLLWHTFLGSSEIDEGLAIAVDSNGDIFVAGRSFDPWGVPINGFTHSATDGFLAKLDNDGILQWHTFFGGVDYDSGQAIALSPAGKIYVAGTGESTWGNPIVPYSGNHQVFVAAFDASTGVHQWNTFLGSATGKDTARAIALDSAGNIYVGGQSPDAWGTPVMPFVGGIEDAFLAKFDSNGVRLWNTFVGGLEDDVIFGVAVDGFDDIIVSGFSTATWGAPIDPFSERIDAFAAKLSPNGQMQWNTFMGGRSDDRSHAVTTDGDNNIYLTGFSGDWGNPLVPHSGQFSDAFIVQLNASGTRQWSTFVGGAGDQRGRSIGVDAQGKLNVAGSSTASWGSGVNPYAGGQDFFVAQLIITNQPPVADDDLYAANEDEVLNADAPGVLAGDTDVEHDMLTAALDGTTGNGSLLLDADGSFSYAPNSDFCGQDSFSYHANDGSDDSNIATVTIDVACVNDPPAVTAVHPTVVAGEGTETTNMGTVDDVENDPVALTASVGAVSLTGNGTWSWRFTPTDGPADGQLVTIFADDGHGGTAQITFDLTVHNVGPTIDAVSNDGPVNEGGSAAISVSAIDPAGGSDPLSYAFDCDGDGVYEVGPQASNATTCWFGENGLFTVFVGVDDGDGGQTIGQTAVTVHNVPPTIDAMTYQGPDGAGNVIVTVNASDPATANDPLSYAFDCNNDDVYEIGPQSTNTTTCLLSGHESSIIRVKVTDDDNGEALASVTIPANPNRSAVVVGQEGVCLKQKVQVHSGDLIAVQSVSGPYLCAQAELNIGQNTTIAPDSMVLGDTVSLQCGVQVSEVHYNELRNKCAVSIDTERSPLALPDIPLPTLPQIDPSAHDVEVPQQGHIVLDPGRYGELSAKQNSTILFTGGEYHFAEWDIGQMADLYFLAPAEIRIAGRLQLDQGSYLGPDPSTDGPEARNIVIYVAGQNGQTGKLVASPKAVKFGRKTTVHTNLYAPNGTIWIRQQTVATGAFIGRWVTVGQKVELASNSAF